MKRQAPTTLVFALSLDSLLNNVPVDLQLTPIDLTLQCVHERAGCIYSMDRTACWLAVATTILLLGQATAVNITYGFWNIRHFGR